MKKLIVAAGAALIVAGCGGSDGLSKKELASKANEICADYSKQGENLAAPDLTDPAKAQTYFTKAKDLLQKQQGELEDLTPADAVKKDYTALTDATNEVTGLLDELAAAATAKDQKKGAELVQKLIPLSEKVNGAAKKIGANDCAS